MYELTASRSAGKVFSVSHYLITQRGHGRPSLQGYVLVEGVVHRVVQVSIANGVWNFCVPNHQVDITTRDYGAFARVKVIQARRVREDQRNELVNGDALTKYTLRKQKRQAYLHAGGCRWGCKQMVPFCHPRAYLRDYHN